MRLRVEVTAKDIRGGKHNNCTFCPVALAINRALTDGKTARVYGPFGRIADSRGVTVARFTLPRAAADFVRAFDNAAPVAALKFTVTAKAVTP